jgi:uncharacterized membrane protein (UPF0127 family)
VFAFLLLWLMTGFSGLVAANETAGPEFPSTNLVIERPGLAPVGFRVAVATTARQHSYGLMFTPKVPSHTGMLFVFTTDQVRQFWMKNTPVSLDILFFDQSGLLVSQIAHTTPFSETLLVSAGPARYVLEIAGGEAARLAIGAGARLKWP